MYFSLKSDCYFRRYGIVGHIVRPIVSIEEVLDDCGAIFVEQLQYHPQSIDEIVKKLRECFSAVEMSDLKKDALEFYSALAQDGFLNSSATLQDFKNVGFEYSTLESKLAQRKLNAQLEESSSHFLSEYFKEHPFLDVFHVELTSKCNERCVHCYIPHEEKNTEIDAALMMSALDQCRKMGVLTIIFSGGEPMLHPNFTEFLRYGKDLDFNVTVLSNLTMLNDEIMDALKYRHASCVNVSLYSMLPEIHDSITTIQGSFDKTKNNILKLIDNNVPIQINCPVMKQNKDSFHEVIRWGQAHKCNVVTDYLIMARSDRSIDNLDNRLSTDELESVIKHLIENDVVIESNIKSSRLGPKKSDGIKPNDKVCGVGLSTLCMVAGGSVYPCAGWQKYICGDLKESSLREIWEDSPQVNYLRSLRQKHFCKCLNCEDFNYCVMCMARNSNEDPEGNIFNIPKITCDAARIHHEIVEEYYGNSK